MLSLTNPDHRESTLKEIRRDALFVEVPLVQGTDQSKVVLSISKSKQDSFNLISGKGGKMATTISEAAAHILSAVGKDWSKHVVMKRDARRKRRERDASIAAAAKERDAPWPFSVPDREGLAALHEHIRPGDRWIREPK
jgi:hypothetical protein